MKIKIVDTVRGWVIGCLFLLGASLAEGAVSFSLSWDPSPDPTVVGYQVYYGLSSGVYSWNLDAGPSTELTVSNLTAGLTYYFVVVAYDSEDDLSVPSNEIAELIPLPIATVATLAPVTAVTQVINQAVNTGTASLLSSLSGGSTTPTNGGSTILGPFGSVLTVVNQILGGAATTNSDLGVVDLVSGPVSDFTRSASQPVVKTVSPFVALAGAYNGLFYRVDSGNAPEMTVETSGFLGNCLVDSNGVYSARLSVGGFNYAVAGSFDLSGDDNETISRVAHNLPDLNVSLHLDLTGQTQQITGLVSNLDQSNSWSAPLLADRSTNTTLTASSIVVRLVSSSGSPNLPTGNSYLRINNSTNGVISLFGTLADSTQFSQVAPLSANGFVPLYASLYGGAGIVEGWINLNAASPVGELTWIRTVSHTAFNQRANSFTNTIDLMPFAAAAPNTTPLE